MSSHIVASCYINLCTFRADYAASNNIFNDNAIISSAAIDHYYRDYRIYEWDLKQKMIFCAFT